MLVAGTNHGMFSLEHNASECHPITAVVVEHTLKTAVKGKGSRKTATRTTFEKSQLESRVSDLELGSVRWLAATTTGIYSSTDQGKTWKGGRILGQLDFVSVRAEGSTEVAATRSSVLVSNDSEATWKQAGLPPYVLSIHSAPIPSPNHFVIPSR